MGRQEPHPETSRARRGPEQRRASRRDARPALRLRRREGHGPEPFHMAR